MDRQVICIRWGTAYGPAYVNRLYAMVARNLPGPFALWCLTDDPSGIRPEVRCLPLPPLGCEAPRGVSGIWGKSRLWAPDLGGPEGVALFLDLDVVVTGPLEPFFTWGDPDRVTMMRNPDQPFERLGQSSVYRFRVGSLAPLQRMFQADPQGVAERHLWEQRFLTRHAPGGVAFWPRGWVRHFRRHCVRTLPLNYLLPPRLPPGTRIVIFPGGLNPPDAIAGRWRPGDPVRTPWSHVLAGLRGDRREGLLSHLRHYGLPAPWVEEHWRE